MFRKLIKIFLVLLALTALYFAFDYAKSQFIDWYSDNYIPRPTAYVATEQPDQIVLTWNGDPQTTQAVQWRTSTQVKEGFAQYRPKGGAGDPQEVAAQVQVIGDRMVENDRENHRFSATLTGLSPGSAYEYRVGSKAPEHWSDWTSFSTAPAEAQPFSFVYWGDVQNGYDYWGEFVAKVQEQFSGASFCLIAGDLVNNGDYRDQWDAFFSAENLFMDQRPLIPTLGNHDYDKKEEPWKYLQLFALPENGPKDLAPERAYTVRYSNALFVVLDSNRRLEDQTPWLEEQLKNSDATWKFAMYHHPAYCSAPNRANDYVLDGWGDVFENYGLDIAFQGHDHAYLRTFPMKDGARVKDGEKGVIYVVSVAGNKYYEQEPHDYAEVEFAETSTYQIIDIKTQPDTLTYTSYDLEGNVKDEFVLTK